MCINQSNVRERNHQVAMMKDVYLKSLVNLVYLGEPNGTEAEAFSTLKTITEGTTIDMLDRDWDSRTTATARSFDALQELLSRPWFRYTFLPHLKNTSP